MTLTLVLQNDLNQKILHRIQLILGTFANVSALMESFSRIEELSNTKLTQIIGFKI